MTEINLIILLLAALFLIILGGFTGRLCRAYLHGLLMTRDTAARVTPGSPWASFDRAFLRHAQWDSRRGLFYLFLLAPVVPLYMLAALHFRVSMWDFFPRVQ